MALLQESCGLAKIVVATNQTCLPHFLSFVQHVITIHGDKAEIRANTNSEDTTKRCIIKQLMLLSYEGVMSFSATREQSNSPSPQDETVPDVMSPMFKTLATCADKCPIFLLSVSRDEQPAGELVLSSVQASSGTVRAAEVEISSSTMNFLKVLVSLSSHLVK